MSHPVLRHIANLWTLMGHPSKTQEWPLEQKLRAIKEAGFGGVCWAGGAELRASCEKHGLIFVGGMASGNVADFPRLLQEQKHCGAVQVNVQLAGDEVLTPEAVELALALNRQGKRLGLEPAVETHRGTCTETPEKTYALADAYQRQTGELLPLSWDFSHFAVVKHLVPENFARRLLVRPDLIQRAHQFHFRPFQRPSRSSAHHRWQGKSDAGIQGLAAVRGGNPQMLAHGQPELRPRNFQLPRTRPARRRLRAFDISEQLGRRKDFARGNCKSLAKSCSVGQASRLSPFLNSSSRRARRPSYFFR